MNPGPLLTEVRVSRKGALRWESGHPWIFASDVLDRGGAQPGSAVRVLDPRGRFQGIAHYSSTSQICLRRLSAHNETIDAAFYRGRLQAALAHRARIVRQSDACRLVFSEADLLPGLIVDQYARHLVVQTLNQGMDRDRSTILDVLRELAAPESILLRNDAPVRKHEDLPLETQSAFGQTPDPVRVSMNGVAFEADLVRGQKTGVYLDQRENYVAAAAHARGRALDCFTSTGGFALHLSRSCESVTAIDSSASALEAARRNATLNARSNIDFREADVFAFLAAESGRYSTVVLDPPAFAKSRSAVDSAARGYKEINLRALKLLQPGGVLITCSCSHHMSEAAFAEMLASAALDAGLTLRVLERRAQAADHPVLLTVPETLYLKCWIVEVLA